MKTKDIDVFLLGQGEEIESTYAVFFEEELIEDYREEGDRVLTAKLVVNLPEKKITMSESEFMQMYKALCREAYQQKSAGDMWEPNTYMEYALKFEDK